MKVKCVENWSLTRMEIWTELTIIIVLINLFFFIFLLFFGYQIISGEYKLFITIFTM